MLGTPWNSAQSLRASKTQDLFSPPAVLNTECESCFVVFNSLRLRGLYSPWNSPGQDTGVGSLSLIQGIFPIQGSTQVSRTAGGSLPAEPQGKPKNTGVSSLSLLQWILPSQESNPGLLHCRRILYQLSSQGSPTRCFLTPANLPGPQLLPPCFSNSSSGCLQSYSRNLHNRRPSAGSSQKPCDLGTSTLSPDPRPPSPLSSN